MSAPAATPPTGPVPEATIQAVLPPLVENSRQAGALQVRVEGRRTRNHVELLICDDGPGVAAGDRDRVFEPFFTSRRTSGGTGLGLPIARPMLAASRGELELLPGERGASFQVRLPQALG